MSLNIQRRKEGSVFLNAGERMSRERRENEATGVIDQSEAKSHKIMTAVLKAVRALQWEENYHYKV